MSEPKADEHVAEGEILNEGEETAEDGVELETVAETVQEREVETQAAPTKPKKRAKKDPTDLAFDVTLHCEEFGVKLHRSLLCHDRHMEKGQTRRLKQDLVNERVRDLTAAPPIGLIGPLCVFPDSDGFYYVLGGQHVFTAALQLGDDRERAGLGRLPWQEHFVAHVLKSDLDLDTREMIAGKHQRQQVC